MVVFLKVSLFKSEILLLGIGSGGFFLTLGLTSGNIVHFRIFFHIFHLFVHLGLLFCRGLILEVVFLDLLVGSGRLVGSGVLSEVVLERGDLLAVGVVVLNFHTSVGLVVLVEELEGGEGFNFNSFVLVLGRVVLGNHESSHGLNIFSKRSPVGSKGGAVTTPGSVELNENLVLRLGNLLLEGLYNKNSDGLVVLSGDILSLSESNELTVNPRGDELAERFSSDSIHGTFIFEFRDTSLGRLDDTDARHFFL